MQVITNETIKTMLNYELPEFKLNEPIENYKSFLAYKEYLRENHIYPEYIGVTVQDYNLSRWVVLNKHTYTFTTSRFQVFRDKFHEGVYYVCDSEGLHNNFDVSKYQSIFERVESLRHKGANYRDGDLFKLLAYGDNYNPDVWEFSLRYLKDLKAKYY